MTTKIRIENVEGSQNKCLVIRADKPRVAGAKQRIKPGESLEITVGDGDAVHILQGEAPSVLTADGRAALAERE